MTGKVSNEDKNIYSDSSREFVAKKIRASYPDNNWSLNTLQTICRQVDETGSAVTLRVDSGRSKSVRVAAAGEHFERSV